jgi:hypothetical protein
MEGSHSHRRTCSLVPGLDCGRPSKSTLFLIYRHVKPDLPPLSADSLYNISSINLIVELYIDRNCITCVTLIIYIIYIDTVDIYLYIYIYTDEIFDIPFFFHCNSNSHVSMPSFYE